MNKINKFGLFLSAFVPLFLLLVLKEFIEIINQNWTFNVLNTLLIIILIIFSIYGVFSLLYTIKNINSCKGKIVKIISKKNTTDQHFLGYFSLFVLFAVSFEIEMFSMAIIFMLILVLIGIVYIKNDLYFINPLLNILGYSFYHVEFECDGKRINANAFFKGRLEQNVQYLLCDKFSNLFFLKK